MKIEVLDRTGFVERMDHMGSDLTVVNAARVSFHKYKEAFDEKDEKLIGYLARHGHWSPFGQVQFQFRIRMPIYIARQWYRHTIGLVRNEVSRRYVDDEPTFHVPEYWRLRAPNVKQGSSDEMVTHWPTDYETPIWRTISDLVDDAVEKYHALLDAGIAPEMARMVLPQNMMTEFIETGSLAAYARICRERLHPTAQWEIQLYACAISEIIEGICPVSWEALMKHPQQANAT